MPRNKFQGGSKEPHFDNHWFEVLAMKSELMIVSFLEIYGKKATTSDEDYV